MWFGEGKKEVNSEKKEKMTWTRASILLLNKYIGVLCMYIIFFDMICDHVIDPLMDKLLSLAILTVPDNYVSLDNIFMMIRHPLVLITMLLQLAMICFMCLLKNATILTCLESFYQGHPVRFFQILPCSFKQIKHTADPKNWPIFIYIMIIQPLIDSDLSSSLSSLAVPEFIMDVIQAKVILFMLYAALILVALFFFMRYLFIQQYYILRKESFREAAKHSVSLERREKRTIFLKLILVSWIAVVVYLAIPALVLIGGDLGLVYLFRDFSRVQEVNRLVLNSYGYPVLKHLAEIFINLLVTSYLLVAFHATEKDAGIDEPIVLPEELKKTSGKIRSFHFIHDFIMWVEVLSALVAFVIFALASEYIPEAMTFLDQQKIVIAHKGYSSRAPENTMSAFELATKCKVAEYIELDVRESKEGIPVVIHNESISDASGGVDSRSIYDIKFKELQTIPAPYSFEQGFEEERIPSLEQVLKAYAGRKKLIIEIKMSGRTPDLPAKIVALMEKYNCTEDSFIHSGNYHAIEMVKEINPDIKCGYIITIAFGGFYDLPAADFFTAENHMASEQMIQDAHLRGKEVYVWTINTEESMRRMVNRPVDGVITDYPDKANRIVNGDQSDPITYALGAIKEALTSGEEVGTYADEY